MQSLSSGSNEDDRMQGEIVDSILRLEYCITEAIRRDLPELSDDIFIDRHSVPAEALPPRYQARI